MSDEEKTIFFMGEKDYKIPKKTISMIGCGGGGSRMVQLMTQYLRGRNEINDYFDFSWYLYDLSTQILDISNNIKKESNIIAIPIRPTTLDAGAGGVPFCAEIAFEINLQRIASANINYEEIDNNSNETNKVDIINSSSLNIYVATLGGGTGGRSISKIIPRLRENANSIGTISDIAICIITDEDTRILNHIYNFPFINKEADFLILFENGVINEDKALSEDVINLRAAEIIDFLISIRHPDTLPKPYDGPDFTSIFRRDPNYVNKRWLIPFMYPVEGYDTEEYNNEPILYFIDKIFETINTREGKEEKVLYKRCFCKVEKEKIKEPSSCVVIIRAPKKYIKSFLEKIRDMNGSKIKEIDIFLRGLENKLNIKRDKIIYKFKPDERGFKICILLQNINIMKFEQFNKNLNDGDQIIKIKQSWHEEMNKGIDKMAKAKFIDINKVDEIKSLYKKRFENITEEYCKNYL